MHVCKALSRVNVRRLGWVQARFDLRYSAQVRKLFVPWTSWYDYYSALRSIVSGSRGVDVILKVKQKMTAG